MRTWLNGRLLESLDLFNEESAMDLLLKITEAYCIEHNIPIKRRFTHEELEDALIAVRNAHQALYTQPAPAEACADLTPPVSA